MNEIKLYDLFEAYYDARKNKRNTHDQLKFELNFEQNLIELFDDLKTGKYELSPCIYFINLYPIKREIFAGNFRDRVVHHLIYNYVYKIFDRYFIYDSYSCRVGKGTSFGIKRVERFIRSCSDNYKKDCYILKLDISGYFMNINKEILYEKIEKILDKNNPSPFGDFPGKGKKFKKEISNCSISSLSKGSPEERGDGFLLNLIKKVVFNNPLEKAIFKGKRLDYIGLPKNKSLFFARKGCGLPIGNLTSQLFSNVYLDDFDKFIKYEIECKYYGRYVDDFVIIHENKEFLASLIPRIRGYLLDNLGLTLHPDKIYLQHYSLGVLFLGSFIKPHRTYTRNRTFGNFYKKIQEINKKFLNNEILTKNDFKQYILSPINSYLGFVKHTASFKIKVKILNKLDKNLLKYIKIDYTFNKIVLNYDNLPKFTSLQD